MATVEGDAGMGKSRLVSEALGRPRGVAARTLVGRSHPLEEPFPLGPLVEALRDARDLTFRGPLSPLVGALGGLLPEIAGRLPPPPSPLGDPRAERHVLFRAMVEILDHLGPTLLVLEDLHWADEGTLDFLRFLRAMPPRDLGLVLTYRREELPAGSPLPGMAARLPATVAHARIVLSPLALDEVRLLIGRILDVPDVSEDFAALTLERTAGIPFAVEEVVRMIDDPGEAVGRGATRARRSPAGRAVPWAVGEAVLERVGRLRGPARRIVEAAAVVGLPAGQELLVRVSGLSSPDALAGLGEALEKAVLLEVRRAEYGLRHGLAVQAIQQAIPRPSRAALHARAALALAEMVPRPVARLAHHHREAGRLRDWAVCAEAAADLAASRGDSEAAVRFLHPLLGDEGHLPEADRARVGAKLAVASLSSGASFSVDVLDTLGGLVDDPSMTAEDRGEIRRLLGLLLVMSGDATAGYRQQARSVAELATRPASAAPTMANLAAPWVLEGDEAEHRSWLARAVSLADEIDDEAFQLGALGAQALIPLYFGDPAGWRAVDRIPWTAPAPFQKRQLLHLASNLVGACFHLGHQGRATFFLQRASSLAKDLGWGHYLHVGETSSLMLDWAQGDWDGLEARARRHTEAVAELPGWAALDHLIIGSIRLLRGDLEPAESSLRRAFDTAWGAGAIPVLTAAAGGLSRVELLRGRPDAACEAAARAIEVIERKGIWAWSSEIAPAAVDAMVAARRNEQALALVTRITAGLRGRDAPAAFASLHMCRGILAEARGRHGSAVRELERAERGYQSLPRPYEAARAATRRGLCLLAGSDPRAADVLLGALARFETLGAPADAARLRQVLRRSSIPVPRPRGAGRHSYGSRLSPREEEVAALAARGQTNVEIAGALFISRKTVEHHLSRALAKLGLASRKALPRGGSTAQG